MRRAKPSPGPEKGPDRAFRLVLLVGIVLIWMAHCTPLGKLPDSLSAEDRWREHG